jgi:hypothetical protein
MENEKVDGIDKEFFSKNPPKIKSKGQELYEKELQRIGSQSNRIKELLQNYFDSVKEVKENKKLLPKEKLKKLLTPLISLHEIYFPDYLNHRPSGYETI